MLKFYHELSLFSQVRKKYYIAPIKQTIKMSKDYFELQREEELASLAQTDKHFVFWEHNHNPITMHVERPNNEEQNEYRIKKLNRSINI